MQPNGLKIPLILFLAAMAALDFELAWNSRELLREGYPDFTIFYSAARIVRQGLGHRLYDDATQYRSQQEFASGVSIRRGALPYNHPPFEALIFIPFSFLPYPLGYLLWDLASFLILGVLLFLLRPHVAFLQHVSAAYWLCAVAGFFPTFMALLQGQDIILLLLIFTLVFIFEKEKADFTAGCCLGLGLFLFHLVLPLVLLWLLQKRKRGLLGFFLVASTLTLISVAVVGSHAAFHYPSSVWRMEQVMGRLGTAVPIGMPNLRGLLEGPLAHLFSKSGSEVLIALVSIALVLFTASKWKTDTGTGFNLGFSLCVIVTILVSYHAVVYDLSLLVLPMALILDHVRQDESLRGGMRVALLGPVFLLFFTPLQIFLSLFAQRYSLMALVLLFWLGAVAREIQRSA